MIRRPPRSTLSSSSAASDVYKRQTHNLAVKVGTPTARQIKNKNNKYMASDCPLAGKHLKQLETDTNIENDEALHPIELMAKSYRL